MPALRHVGTSTTASASVMENLLADPHTTKVTFFATQRAAVDDFDEKADGPETNLPLVVALAEYNIPGFNYICLVFDGLFLTRARHPRISEVDSVLDAACKSNKAYFSQQIAPFTSKLSPADAAAVLQKLISLPLNTNSRAAYLRLF